MIANSKILEVELAGGLGNQLFMFYAGLQIGKFLDKEIVFNISDFSRISKIHPGHNLQTLGLLNNKNLIYRPCSKQGLFAQKIKNSNKLIGALTSLKMIQKPPTFQSPEIGYIDLNLIPADSQKIKGYFQTWKYFANLNPKPILSSDSLVYKTPWFLEKTQQVNDISPIALHIRKGDYLLKRNRKNGILANSYYRSILEQTEMDSPIWVFTDSPKLVSEEFREFGSRLEIIDPPDKSDPVESLLLMSMTSEIIISNSTYSWWAATLSKKGTKVYAPSKWFKLAEDPKDLINCEWQRVTSEWELS